MKRRELVAMVSTGVGISLAGCSSSGDSTSEPSSSTGTTTSTEQTGETTERTSTSTTANGDSTSTEATDSETTGAGNESLGLGETAKIDGGLKGTVESYRFTSKYASGGTTQSTNKTFLFVKFNVENPTDSRKDIPAKMSIYVTANGKRYDPTDYKGAVRSLYTSGSLDAGAKRSGVLIFEVPKRTKRSDVVSFFRYSGSDGTVTRRWRVE